MDIAGSCHCGNIRYTLHWPMDDGGIPARRCGCTFCTKHGGAWTSHPQARLRVQVSDARYVNRYAFGTETADFVMCTRCGVAPLVTSAIEGSTYAVVNVNTFDGVARERIKSTPSSFEGEDAGSRLQRRRRNWIADVQMEEAG